MKSIRVTSLGSVYACAFKYKNDTYDIDPAATFKGDIINAAATGSMGVEEFIEYYTSHISEDLKLKIILRECSKAASLHIDGLKATYEKFAQERKFIIKFGDMYIEGTPDIYYCMEDGKWMIEDIKMSTHSWFQHEDSWTYNLQTYIYPYFIMEYYGVDECSFQYCVFDKGNAKKKIIGPRLRTRAECEQVIWEAIAILEEAELTGERPTRVQRTCFFCKLKPICPAYNKKATDISV